MVGKMVDFEGNGKPGCKDEMEELKKAYAELERKHEQLETKYQLLLDTKRHPFYSWMPYIKLTVVWTITALFLLIFAERQYVVGSKVGFGVLSAIGGASVFLAIPATHWIGRYLHKGYRLFQPFQGGARFVILQAISWTFYSITALIIIASVAYAEHTNGLLASAGVIGTLSQVFMVSSLLTYSSDDVGNPRLTRRLKSSPLFDDSDSAKLKDGDRRRIRSFAKSLVDVSALLDDPKALLEPDSPKGAKKDTVVGEFIKMNMGLVLLGILLGIVSQHTYDDRHRPMYAALSSVCCIAAVFLTYGIAGRLRHKEKGWSFGQAFEGGRDFVVMQIAGWCIFGIAVLAQGLFILSSIYVGTQLIPGQMYVAAIAMVVAQIILVHSMRYFKPVKEKSPAEQPLKKMGDPFSYRELPVLGVSERLKTLLLITIFCNTQFVSFTIYMVLFCLPYMIPTVMTEYVDMLSLGLIPVLDGEKENFYHTFTLWFMLLCTIAFWLLFYSALKLWGVQGWRLSLLLSTSAVWSFGGTLTYNRESPHYPMLLLIIALNFVYISTTYQKRPEINACREWPEMQRAINFSEYGQKFFGLRLVVSKEMKEVAPSLGDENATDERLRQVILLLHPHGILPLTHGWLAHSADWKRIFPKLKVNPLTATITHFVPVMRDIIQWFGTCDVSREAIHNLISMGRNIQIVCGGQTEMFESKSWEKNIVVVRRRRRGVFKIAIQQGLGVIPMFSFGECLTFDNIYMPKVQTFFKNTFGFPFPFVMLGQYGLPVPRRVPITIAMGAPVHPVKKNENPTEEEITELHERYFQALEDLFEEFKNKNGHAEYSIKWHDN
mmetsp:Transcript_7413/g.11898  ORF Transcript_7413/g.11898 Transcript_7413/m.11898 type:complete len:832 (+) Transcript_7413:2044-4539(+)